MKISNWTIFWRHSRTRHGSFRPSESNLLWQKFVVDAHLPRRLAAHLRDAGHDALHTLDLPAGNRAIDKEINAISVSEQRIVVTKDSDFVVSFVLHGQPWKLLLVSTGNFSNRKLEQLVAANISAIVEGGLLTSTTSRSTVTASSSIGDARSILRLLLSRCSLRHCRREEGEQISGERVVEFPRDRHR